MLTSAWDQVLATTIVTALKRPRFLLFPNENINNNDGPFSVLKDDLKEMDGTESSLNSGFSAETFSDIDVDLQSSNALLTDEDILNEVTVIQMTTLTTA